MINKIAKLITESTKIAIIQAENPDGDSLGSALALDEILGDINKQVSLYCPIDIPKYMYYIKGWDRVTNQFDTSADLAIILDTTSDVLLSKALDQADIKHFFYHKPIIVIDHHNGQPKLDFPYNLLNDEAAVSTGELVYKLAASQKWPINQTAAEDLLITIMSDSLGLTTETVKPETYFIAGELARLGANNYQTEIRRREHMKKSADILRYKGELIGRIEYYLDGKLALIKIPFEEIQVYSDKYNPSMLVLDEMRLVEGVEVGVAIKTYPDGKLTGKIRSNLPISDKVASYFGGGGHQYAAGFRVHETIDKIIPELLDAVDKVIKED